MCELYPNFKSCCGVSVRLALVYIAILSIVTGAMINAALKKAGVNIASIEDIKDLNKPNLNNPSLNDNFKVEDGLRLRYEESGVNQEDASKNDTETPVNDADNEDANNTLPEPDNDDDYGETTANTTTAPTTATPTTTTIPTTTISSLLHHVSSVNRNGMNLLSCAFVALGILLLVANFLKSPELVFVYMVSCLAVTVAALVLLVGVLGECVKARDTCLLRHMDWFSSFVVMLFWFLYIFVWLFFAGVANAFANGTYEPAERQPAPAQD